MDGFYNIAPMFYKNIMVQHSHNIPATFIQLSHNLLITFYISWVGDSNNILFNIHVEKNNQH